MKGNFRGSTLDSTASGNSGYVSAGYHCAAALLWLRNGPMSGSARTCACQRGQYLSASQPPPAHPDEPAFHPLPEIKHTFRPDQRVPPIAVSGFFALLVASPLLVLFGMVRITSQQLLANVCRYQFRHAMEGGADSLRSKS